MMRFSFPAMAGAALVVTALLPAPAVGTDTTDERLREALRSATIQQRALEDEVTRLQAQNAEYEGKIQTLQGQVAARVAPAVVERMEAEFNERLATKNEAIDRLGEHLERFRSSIGQLTENLEKWKAAYQEAAEVARTKEAARVRLVGENATLSERVTVCEAKNVELFKVGSEILDRYANVDLADTMEIREPFLGFKRVELQNLVQDYHDRLLDQQLTQ